MSSPRKILKLDFRAEKRLIANSERGGVKFKIFESIISLLTERFAPFDTIVNFVVHILHSVAT
jgi:hypothetical protein